MIFLLLLAIIIPTEAIAKTDAASQSTPQESDGGLLSKAKEKIQAISEQTESIMQDSSSRDAKKERFLTLFKENFNVPAIARHVLRKYWAKANNDEKKKYVDLFQQDIVNTYFGVLEKYYHKEKLIIIKAIPSKDHAKACYVLSEARNPEGGPPIMLKWQLLNNRILDVIVDKASLSNAKFQEYRKMYRDAGGSFPGFLSSLENKVNHFNQRSEKKPQQGPERKSMQGADKKPTQNKKP